ncbi:hypothetical protein VMUT_1142 [Vulcanisaeta moutnovskia 768-28]|uniref:Uncharacterized protein n=1 Tax=Vulcanisaeta moutnovskia (strain 768-28) TaxID=985053 RepID=F0QYB0_VULM7|nr:hypothetical protein VMUT_1142 [Vulcanisaeta moutnovskia 768-28]
MILNDYKNVKLFRELIFEVHGHEKELLSKLSVDYRCSIYEKHGGKLVRCIRLW